MLTVAFPSDPDKFYSLTEPVIRSILSGSVTAEFPFDISEEEVDIIRHFKSASLIIGRSGTGKTTCLVYKLLSKYLARVAIQGERPVRQVGACLPFLLLIRIDYRSLANYLGFLCLFRFYSRDLRIFQRS